MIHNVEPMEKTEWNAKQVEISFVNTIQRDVYKRQLYEYVVFVLVFFIFTVTALLINPFIQLYTRDVTDANYNQPIFGILLIISEGLYLVKFPHLRCV